jgi:hypothetical protein
VGDKASAPNDPPEFELPNDFEKQKEILTDLVSWIRLL